MTLRIGVVFENIMRHHDREDILHGCNANVAQKRCVNHSKNYFELCKTARVKFQWFCVQNDQAVVQVMLKDNYYRQDLLGSRVRRKNNTVIVYLITSRRSEFQGIWKPVAVEGENDRYGEVLK